VGWPVKKRTPTKVEVQLFNV